MKVSSVALLVALTACSVYAADVPANNDDEVVHRPFPEFSWDKIPLYIHVRKEEAFDQKELEYLASFPLITFEKTTGMETYGSTDAGTVEAAKSVKLINPKARILFYRNVLVHYPFYSFDKELDDIQAPFLKSNHGKGNLVRGEVEAYDLSNPKLVDWWLRNAAKGCADEAVDGLFLDGNIKALVPYLDEKLPPGKKAAVTAAYHDMMKQTRDVLGPDTLLLANIIRARMPDSGLKALEYFEGSYLEGFTVPIGDVSKADYIVKGIEAFQKAARDGKIIAMTLGFGDSEAAAHGIDDTRKKLDSLTGRQAQVDFYLAMFLVCAEKYSYLNLHDGYDVNKTNGSYQSKMWLQRLPEYDKPLGAPKGVALRKEYIFTREFAHATVFLDVKNEIAKIEWHGNN